MYITIDTVNQFRDAFRDAGRKSQFSNEGLGLLFDYLEDVAPDYELDVVALCCEYSEDSPEQIARDYSINLNDCDFEDDDYAEQCAALVMEYLNNNTALVGVTSAGSIIYAQF